MSLGLTARSVMQSTWSEDGEGEGVEGRRRRAGDLVAADNDGDALACSERRGEWGGGGEWGGHVNDKEGMRVS